MTEPAKPLSEEELGYFRASQLPEAIFAQTAISRLLATIDADGVRIERLEDELMRKKLDAKDMGEILAHKRQFQETQAKRVADLEVQNGSMQSLLSANEPRIAELERASRTRPDYDLRCQACGAPHWLDVAVPSETWNQIAEAHEMLCLLCIDSRLSEVGLTAEAEFYYSGKSLRSRMYHDE